MRPKRPRAANKEVCESGLAVNCSRQFEKLLKGSSVIKHYSLRLYVTGTSPHSAAAVANIRSLCEEYIKGHYDLEVVDIYQKPGEAQDQQIIAAPTLIKSTPLPLKRVVGNLSDREKVMVILDLQSHEAGQEGT
jgi:circadian clock protein KaiB